MSIKIITTTRYIDEEGGFEFAFEPIEDTLSIAKTKSGFEARYLTDCPDYDTPNQWDGAIFLVNFHRDFNVEDERISKEEVKSWYQGEKIEQDKDYFIFGLSLYSHSGCVLSLNTSFSCDSGGWDTSHVGVVLVSRKGVESRGKAIEAAKGLIETWNYALSGEVYTIVKETYDKDKNQLDYDCVGGFYGLDYALEDLKTF